ncbi:MAG: hypothetical protein ACLTTE_05465 [Clostridia bacterium]
MRFANTDTYCYVVFGSGDNSVTSDGYGLRPVVSLPSSLLTGEQTNGAWNLSK